MDVIGLGLEILYELLCFLVDVVALESRVVHDRIISANRIETETRRCFVMEIIDVSEDVSAGLGIILIRVPDHFNGFFVQPGLFILIVNS